jgi:hypothetical protein
MATGLQAMKDLILPGLWGRDPDGRSDIMVNLSDDCLDIEVNGRKSKFLTRDEIDDGSWKDVVSNRIDEALRKGAS